MKRCTVVYATPARQWTWTVEVPGQANVAEVLQVARLNAVDADVPWDADVGIFGELCTRAAIPRDGDRVEIYRPLKSDPKESRRARAAAGRAAADPASVPPRAPPKSAR
jgi:uncharacterized protein